MAKKKLFLLAAGVVLMSELQGNNSLTKFDELERDKIEFAALIGKKLLVECGRNCYRDLIRQVVSLDGKEFADKVNNRVMSEVKVVAKLVPVEEVGL